MWEQIRGNQRRAAFLVAGMAALMLFVGYAAGEFLAPGAGVLGLSGALLLWIILTAVSYFQGDSIFLALAGARPIDKQDHPVLFNVVEEMTVAAGLPRMPAVYIVDDPSPNAFATGRDAERAAVAVTSGLLELMDRDELQGVVAHELGHVKNRDVLYMLMVGIMMGVIVMLADLGARMVFYGGGRSRTSQSSRGGQGQALIIVVALVLMILAPILARLLYFALSRRREYLADASSALFTRYPEGLARALEKLSHTTVPLRAANRATAPMYIVNPLAISSRGLRDLTSTHPRTTERIRILRAMAGGAGLPAYNEAFRTVTGRRVGVVPFSALQESPAVTVPARSPMAALTTHLDRVRATGDALWRLNSFVFIACACETTLKIPADYAGRTIPCPHCGTGHAVPHADPGR
jgi:heat shock protein HtpX